MMIKSIAFRTNTIASSVKSPHHTFLLLHLAGNDSQNPSSLRAPLTVVLPHFIFLPVRLQSTFLANPNVRNPNHILPRFPFRFSAALNHASFQFILSRCFPVLQFPSHCPLAPVPQHFRSRAHFFNWPPKSAPTNVKEITILRAKRSRWQESRQLW